MEAWSAVIADPRFAPVVEYFMQFGAALRKSNMASQSDIFENMFRIFRSDDNLLDRIAAVTDTHDRCFHETTCDLVLHLDSKWMNDIEHWARA